MLFNFIPTVPTSVLSVSRKLKGGTRRFSVWLTEILLITYSFSDRADKRTLGFKKAQGRHKTVQRVAG